VGVSAIEVEVCFRELQKAIHDIAVDHGWWDKERNSGECIALMHSELSEALEFLRQGNSKSRWSDHIPDYLGIEEELADTIIRILDFAEARKYNVAAALLAKMEFNRNRPHKHGGKRM
jgi:NTP pyrophosphatase (non-canonical NTP hydrolase)